MEDCKIVNAFDKFKTLLQELSIIPALVESLIFVIEQSRETTMQGLFSYISKNTDELFEKIESDEEHVLKGRSILTIKSANEIFQRHLRKSLNVLNDSNIENIKKNLIVTGHEFKNLTIKCKDTIKDLALDFIKNGLTILVYGYSKLVEHVLLAAAEKNVRFSVIVPEVRPNCEGYEMYKSLKSKIPVVTLVIDANIAFALEKADIVLVGAESVVENGGIINRAGTYMTAICAKTLKKPFYVVTESFKFTRLFPLSQKDLPEYVISKDPFQLVAEKAGESFKDENIKAKVQALNPLCDYTPPEFITLIFTDVGIFTPSAVSDELIQIFNT